MRIRNTIMFGILVAALAAIAEPEVTDVVAKQRYPWNGLVDITCKVAGISGTANDLKFIVTAVMSVSNTVRKVSNLWVLRNGAKSTDLAVHTNGSYRLVWDAQAELGQGTFFDVTVWVTLNAHGKVQLWKGGPYWAETNIGAEVPWEYGYYFWWGDTVGYNRENNKWVATDGSSSNFSFSASNTPTYGKSIATLKNECWITEGGVLAPEHDAAHVHWGGDWRMPTDQELSDLNSKCDWTLTVMNGVVGYVVKGKGTYASASIFFPCAGLGDGTSLDYAGSRGYYWSSVPNSGNDYDAWRLYFGTGYRSANGSRYRYYGRSVRPVQGFTN